MNTPTMQLLDQVARRGPDATDRVGRALLLAQSSYRNQHRRNGDSYMEHAIAVALILVSSGADTDSVVAAVLHDTPGGPTPIPVDQLRHEFGDRVADLLSDFHRGRASHTIVANAFDTVDRRVLHLNVAHGLHNMRTIDCFEAERQCYGAAQARAVVAPAARAAGLTDLAHELDTLAEATLRAHAPQRLDRVERPRVPGVRTLYGALRLGGALLAPHRREHLLQDWEGELHAAAGLAERFYFTASVLLHLPYLAVLTRRTDRP